MSVGGCINFNGEPTERMLVSGKLKFKRERESTERMGFPLLEVEGGILLLIIDWRQFENSVKFNG